MMKKFSKTTLVAVTILVCAGLIAHPHFRKEVSAKVGNTTGTISYFTAPANESHIADVPVGKYVKSFATLNLSNDVTVGDMTLTAGDYNVGAIKNNDAGTDWTMALHQGALGFNDEADESKVMKLPSMFTMENGKAEHLYFDIAPGFGKMQGKPILIWHFGKYYLAGALN